ncbi:PQQ-binding-like beta-propeller repeat protein [Nonomuraea sp. NPDC046802]|uniref:outer membrane protein assembly factor BamB family protein n=1 Tax=Nonomuraea sp. NPDC046802 TaxID=3154919 RepID=UPI0033C8E08E
MITRWAWFGAGLTVAGIAVTGWAYADWLFSASSPGRLVVPGLVLGLGVLLLVSSVFPLVRAVRLASRREPPPHPYELETSNRELGSARRRAWTAAVLLTALGVYGWSQALEAFEGGFPELGMVGFAGGLTVLVAGPVVAATRVRRADVGPPRRADGMAQPVGDAEPGTAAGAGSPGGAGEGVEPGASVGAAEPGTAAGAGSPGGAGEGVEPGASVGAVEPGAVGAGGGVEPGVAAGAGGGSGGLESGVAAGVGGGEGAARRNVVAGVGGGLAVGAVAALAAFLAVTLLPVDAVTAERAVKPSAAVPVAVSRVAWQWEAPSLVRDAVPAGPGIVVRVRDGVVALDTATGKPRWHYRRPGAYTVELFGAPDGGTVIVTFSVRFSVRSGSARLVTLDAHTGELRSQRDRPAGGLGGVHHVALTSRGLAQQSGPSELTGWDLDEDRGRWLYEPPGDCRFAGNSQIARYVALREVIAVMLMCRQSENLRIPHPLDNVVDMKVEVVGLDPADGRQVWSHERSASADPYSLDIRAAADGDALAVLTGGQDFLLSQADGKVIGDLDLDALPTYLEYEDTAFDGYVGFGADGFLTTDREKAGPKPYRWEPFGAGEPKQVSLPWPSYGSQRVDLLPLRDVLLSTVRSRHGKEKLALTVTATRWDTGETVRFPDVIEFVDERSDLFSQWPKGAPLLETPGAITVIHGGGSKVVGLAG